MMGCGVALGVLRCGSPPLDPFPFPYPLQPRLHLSTSTLYSKKARFTRRLIDRRTSFSSCFLNGLNSAAATRLLAAACCPPPTAASLWPVLLLARPDESRLELKPPLPVLPPPAAALMVTDPVLPTLAWLRPSRSKASRSTLVLSTLGLRGVAFITVRKTT